MDDPENSDSVTADGGHIQRQESGGGFSPPRLPPWADALPPVVPLYARPVNETERHPDEVKLAAVEERLGYEFRDRRLLRCALTSTGRVNEHREEVDNEGLEWLGDAVLYLVVTDLQLAKTEHVDTSRSSPERDSLISDDNLEGVGAKLGLWDVLFLGKGERANNVGGRGSFLADAVEALIGAIYLDARAAGDPPLPTTAPVIRRLLNV